MSESDFRTLSLENWLEPDSVSLSMLPNPEDWPSHVLKIKLNEGVPHDLRTLFEVAKAVMLYGFFFYPMFTVGAERLIQMTEGAVHHKILEVGGSKNLNGFKRKLDWLISKNIVSPPDKNRWQAIRELRNVVSHPIHQMILTPGNALGVLERTAIDIDSLFVANSE